MKQKLYARISLLVAASLWTVSLVASEVTLWTSPRTKDLGDIVGAYSYTIDVDKLCLKNAGVVVAYPPSTVDGMTLYGWQPVSGHMTIPSIINGWDVNNNYRTIIVNSIAPDTLDSNVSPFQKLTSVTIGEGIIELGGVGAFYGANGLKSASLPSTLKTIGNNSFRNCSALTSIDIPDSVETIGTRAFFGCSNLRIVKSPTSLTIIGERAFQDAGVVSVDLSDTCVSIGQYAFSGCTSLSHVNLGSCTGIGNYSFQNCSNLISVDFPASMQFIGNSAFVGCSALSRIHFSERLLTIGESAFSRCAAISELDLPDGLTTIGEKAFQYCTGVSRLVIPSSVTSVGPSTFNNCAPRELVEGAFWTMTYSNVTNFTLLPGAAVFGNKFRNSAALEKVTIPDTVTKIEAEAFKGCTNLSCAIIPDSVEIVGNSAFYNCKSLPALPLLGGSVTNWGSSVFRYCTGVSKLSVPGNMKTIPDYMFANCSNLVDVVVSEGIETIAQTAFLYDDLIRSLSLPSTAANLSYGSYSNTDYAKNLEAATFHQLHPPKNVAEAFLRNFTGIAYYPPDYAGEWNAALSDAGLSGYGKSWSEAQEDEPGAVDVDGVNVPYGWLAKYGLVSRASPEVAARAETGKFTASGKVMEVWQDYMAGTDPTDRTSQFTAQISITNGLPCVSWSPNLNTNGVVRIYTILGKENLTDDVEWTPTNSTHRFFRVRIDMP